MGRSCTYLEATHCPQELGRTCCREQRERERGGGATNCQLIYNANCCSVMAVRRELYKVSLLSLPTASDSAQPALHKHSAVSSAHSKRGSCKTTL